MILLFRWIANYRCVALLSQEEQPGTYKGLSFAERLQLLTDNEEMDRTQRKQQRLLKAAKLKIDANHRDTDYQHPGGLKPSMINQLPSCQWYQSIGDNMLADAILDRLIHNESN